MSYETEEEQLIAIKQFWNRHGTKILSVLLCLTVSFYGFRLWQEHTMDQISEASDLFQQMSELATPKQFGQNLTDDQKASFNHLFETLSTEYPNTIYMEYAYILKAKQLINQKNISEAKSVLASLIEKNGNSELKALAHIRLACLLSEEGKEGAQAAIKSLETFKKVSGFEMLYEETLGDAWWILEDFSKAHKAYKKAADYALKNGEIPRLLKLKLDNTVQAEELVE